MSYVCVYVFALLRVVANQVYYFHQLIHNKKIYFFISFVTTMRRRHMLEIHIIFNCFILQKLKIKITCNFKVNNLHYPFFVDGFPCTTTWFFVRRTNRFGQSHEIAEIRSISTESFTLSIGK